MPNLVGIGNSQVPTNAMLGGLAYQDSVGEIDIEKIKAKISKTAVDIFVYDTRKDSDGGAWRHRTQNKSWYNEGVSRYRGARKEFPAVAVLVLEGDDFIIYDGDDPNLPMWMVFIDGSNTYFQVTTNACVAALNGKIVSGGNASNDRLRVIDFLLDNEREYSHSAGQRTTLNPISDRNGSTTFGPYNASLPGIVNRYVNAVAMTVQPNAPIDSATGLPIPTIAVGTQGGLSVIRDDGTVFDYTGFNPVTFVAIEKDVVVGALGGTSTHDFIFKTNLLTKDEQFDVQILSGTGNYYMNSNNGTTPLLRDLNMTAMAFNPSDTTIYRGGNNGFDIITETDTLSGTVNNSLIAYVDTDYNSGYMVGDIRGAFLADTDTTTASIANRNLILNSTFANTNNWTGASNGVLTAPTGLGSYAGGTVLRITNATGSNGRARSNSFSTTVGKKYGIKVSFTNRSSNGQYRVEVRQVSYDLVPMSGTTTAGVYEFEFTSAGTGTYILELYCLGGQNEWAEFDNVYVYELEQDRTTFEKGLFINGSIVKEPVATGSDLVYYRNFSNSNYFSQPYNSALDVGTGDLYIMFWMKNTQNDAYDDLIHRRAHNGSAYTGNGWYIQMGNDQNITLKDSADSGSRAQVAADSVANVWRHICFVRKDNVGYAYKDGVLQPNTYAWTENLDNSSAILTIGRGTISGSGDSDKSYLALVRIGASAPLEKQIKKIYNDEKHLFQKNAKCTISGATSAVTALGFDDSTDTLHVGTSSGRSDFRGLNRINNTTTAVTTAISASNGLVAEQ